MHIIDKVKFMDMIKEGTWISLDAYGKANLLLEQAPVLTHAEIRYRMGDIPNATKDPKIAKKIGSAFVARYVSTMELARKESDLVARISFLEEASGCIECARELGIEKDLGRHGNPDKYLTYAKESLVKRHIPNAQ